MIFAEKKKGGERLSKGSSFARQCAVTYHKSERTQVLGQTMAVTWSVRFLFWFLPSLFVIPGIIIMGTYKIHFSISAPDTKANNNNNGKEIKPNPAILHA
jgi:hypothetical protein